MTEEDAAEQTEPEESNPGCSLDNQIASNDFEVGDFAIIKFDTKKRHRLFIAAENKVNGEYTVRVLRKKATSKQVFCVSECPGHFVKKEQLMKKVVGKLCRRGQHIFEDVIDVLE